MRTTLKTLIALLASTAAAALVAPSVHALSCAPWSEILPPSGSTLAPSGVIFVSPPPRTLGPTSSPGTVAPNGTPAPPAAAPSDALSLVDASGAVYGLTPVAELTTSARAAFRPTSALPIGKTVRFSDASAMRIRRASGMRWTVEAAPELSVAPKTAPSASTVSAGERTTMWGPVWHHTLKLEGVTGARFVRLQLPRDRGPGIDVVVSVKDGELKLFNGMCGGNVSLPYGTHAVTLDLLDASGTKQGLIRTTLSREQPKPLGKQGPKRRQP